MTRTGAILRGALVVAIAVLSFVVTATVFDWRTIVGCVLVGFVTLRAYVDQSLGDAAKTQDDEALKAGEDAVDTARSRAPGGPQGGFALIPGISLTPSQKAAKQAQVVAYAKSQIGKGEVPKYSNWGPYVQKILAFVGIGEPASWCMAFVVDCFQASTYLVVNGLTLIIKTASCQQQADHARASGLLVAASDAIAQGLRPGWVMLMWESALNRYAHCGIVIDVDPAAKTFDTCEGNTNDDGGREGYAVMTHTRRIGDTDGAHAKYAFIRTS